MARWWLVIGSVAGMIGVAGGAFGAHALKARLPEAQLANFDTGTRYLLAHAVALLVVGVLARGTDSTGLTIAGGAFTIGMLVFTGSLWVLSITGMKWLGAITPIGGLALIAGWIALAVTTARSTGV